MESVVTPKAAFRQELVDALESQVTLDHPIFQKLMGAEPNHELLRHMALQGYQLTKNFLFYIENLFFYCPLPKHKHRLLINLFEEETGHFSQTDNHVVLMQKFIRALGITDEERDAVEPYPETKALIDYRRELVSNPETYHRGAAAVLIASEGQNLETLGDESRDSGLSRMYGLSADDLLFFSVHEKEDVGHVNQGLDLVVDLCTTAKMQEEALEAVHKTCALFRGMYDGVAKRS